MPRTTRMISLGLLVACNGNESMLPPPHDVQASWQVRCVAPNEPCDYPVRTVAGTIGPDDPAGYFVDCDAADGALDVSVAKITTITPTETVPGYALHLDVGYDPATGFDLFRCAVLLDETDERVWGAQCSEDAPSFNRPCQLGAPTLVDGTFSATLRCIDLPSIPFQANRDANLASGADPNTPIALQVSGCDIEQP